MPSLSVALLAFLFAQQGITAANKGVCPPPPSNTASIAVPARTNLKPPTTGVHYIGTVTMLVSLSETGSICGVTVVKGIEPALDKQAVAAIESNLFQPIELDGKAIAGSMIVQRDFWRGDASDFVVAENANAVPDEITSGMKAVSPPENLAVLDSGIIDADTYRNPYFGMSFTAPGATLNAEATIHNRGNAVRLVDAIAASQNRYEQYSISVIADPLSLHPQLKSVKQYVGDLCFQLEQQQAKHSRCGFALNISGVPFMGAMLEETDGPRTSHSRGIFSSVMKGYVLTFEITAASDQRVLDIASSVHFDKQ